MSAARILWQGTVPKDVKQIVDSCLLPLECISGGSEVRIISKDNQLFVEWAEEDILGEQSWRHLWPAAFNDEGESLSDQEGILCIHAEWALVFVVAVLGLTAAASSKANEVPA